MPTWPARACWAESLPDAHLAATRAREDGGAAIAFTNPGGIRAGLQKSADGVVTYADLFAAQPFGNNLVTLTLTGKQIKTLLEQQWLDQAKRAFCRSPRDSHKFPL